MNKRLTFLAGVIVLLIIIFGQPTVWGAPARDAADPDKTKKPTATEEDKTRKPPHPTKTPRGTVPPLTEPPLTETPLTESPPTEPPPTELRPPTQPPETEPPPTQPPPPTVPPPTQPPPTNERGPDTPTPVSKGPSATSGPQVRRAGKEKPPTAAPTLSETSTPTETETPTGTSTVVSTLTQTTTGTPTLAAILSPTSASSTPTRANLLPPLPVATPFASAIALNELLSRPEGTDWNGDGLIDVDDQWVELYNPSSSRVDLSGWLLSTFDGSASATFTFPQGTTIAAQSYRVFYRKQTKISLSMSGGQMRLLYPDGRTADSVRYPELGPDRSFTRSSDRGKRWTVDCAPSPHAPNCSAGATLTSNFNLSFFQNHIVDASVFEGIHRGVLATNTLLALLLALVLGFCADMLNTAIVRNGAQAWRIVGPLVALAQTLPRAAKRRLASVLSRPLFWVGTPIRLAVLYVACGSILAFLDPNLDLRDLDAWLLIVATSLSLGLVSACVLAVEHLILRHYGSRAKQEVHGGRIVLLLGTTLLSRLMGFVPGVFIAGPTRLEASHHPAIEAKVDLAAISVLVLLGAGAWGVAPVFETDAWFKTLLLLTYAAAVQTLFFELLPFRNLRGRALFESNRAAWLVLFALTSLVLLQTMLNPDGSSVAAFQSATMMTLAITVGVFAASSAFVSLYLHALASPQTKQN